MTHLLMVILHDLTYIPELLDAWKEIGVPGVTILNSVGGFHASEIMRRRGLGSFLNMFEEARSDQRTLFSLIDDTDLLEQAISEADRIVKGFDSPQSGILFTMPISQVLGLQKWGSDKPQDRLDESESEPEDQSISNLLQWLEDDIDSKYGEGARIDWSEKRAIKISEITSRSNQVPILVRMDQELQEVLGAFTNNPDACLACVVNKEKRLMGIINTQSLAEMMFLPVMPEEYIVDPQGYEQALKYADPSKIQVAAEIMSDPLFIHPDDRLEEAFHIMKEHNLPGLPVVDKYYHITGFVSLLDLMNACFITSK
jgi:hypothetical protein